MQKVKWQIKIQNGILHPGTPRFRMTKEERKWIPAYAGMTTFARLGMTPHQITAEAFSAGQAIRNIECQTKKR